MNSLRAKFALLLVVSIVAVVALITLTMMYFFATPKDIEAGLLARQLITLERLAKQNPESELLSRQPPAGEPDGDAAELLRAAAAQLGATLDVAVTHHAKSSQLRTASLRVGPGSWVLVDIDSLSDPALWEWLAFITIGVGSIAVFAAHRMSRPLALLEAAAESIGPDGSVAVFSERGPAEVRATAAAINSLSLRLKRAMESRMRLVAAAGHDFRTPLTRMRLRAEFVSDDEEQALWLKDIDELERIADSAIQLVREESANASVEVIRVDELVKTIVEELRQQNLPISVMDTVEAYAKANRLALSRALRNLLINAATHGVRGVVNVTGGTSIKVTISDEGPGIAPNLLDQVFEPFFRADRARRQAIPGAGLGLTISREIVRKYGGDIRIRNSADGGLVQIVDLPSVT